MGLSLLQIALGAKWEEANKLVNVKVEDRIRTLFAQNLSCSSNCSLKLILGNSSYKDCYNDLNGKDKELWSFIVFWFVFRDT